MPLQSTPVPADPRDYKLDIRSLQPDGTDGAAGETARAGGARPFLSVHFRCCGVYQRVYRNADGTAYEGRCPKCLRPVKFVVGDGGTSARSFVVE
jgi:hypothetical protein